MAEKTYRIVKVSISLFSLILFVYATAEAKIIYVDNDGPTDFDNIQAAIDDSNHGDIIIVSPGTYTGAGNRDISFNGKAITVCSEDPNDPNIVAATIIDCNGTEDQPHRGFLFNSGEEANSVLAGLTITNGYAYTGGGIYCETSRPNINNCILVANSALGGGGMSIENSNPILINCIFSGNSARSGGGIYITDGNTTLTDCFFGGNSADEGGGMCNCGDCNTTLINCTFVGNYAGYYGGGIYNGRSSRTILTNCTFTDNSVFYVDIMWGFGGGIHNFSCISTLTNCTFNKNSANWGGGIHNTRNSNISLTECIFSENSASRGGGGLYNVEDSNTTLTECIFIKNSAGGGGGLSNVLSKKMTLTKCVFSENSANSGGGMGNFISYSTLTNCVFSGNLTEHEGGGMYNVESIPTLKNSTLSGNWAGTYGGGIYNKRSDTSLANCILWGNKSLEGRGQAAQIYGSYQPIINYCCIEGWTGDLGGIGNIGAYPLFVEPGYLDVNGVWIDGDYRLQPESPCIDAGDLDYITEPNETDLDGRPRIMGGRIDMGAYEYFSPRPVAEAGPDQVVECACNTQEGTKVTLDGTGSYDEGDNPLTFTWTGSFVESPANGATPTVTLEDGCPGEYVITLVVNNGIEDSEPNDVVITIVDTTPPEFSLTVSPAVMWPPNHKMVEITPSWTVSDECDASPDVSLVGIVMSEGDDTIGVGHTSDDIQIGEDGSIYLRAERSGAGSDRVYTITYQAVDDSGNTTVRSATVSIPHDFKVLAGIGAKWLWIKPAGRISEDLNGDGIVNLTDFAKFAENWIK